ncbi:hypothetical protein [Streptomyces sp. NPDC018031]|uniref:hypothetical protein n=1 Tax=Streptomyces sp. NPDC018031 TaxID=3365033 RepID=UPI00378C0FF5
MSRESDSSSSGPRGSGGAAYPSGTPPYGSRQYPSLNPTQQAPLDGPGEAEPRGAALPEEPKTETTLTTRIKINIPGSRPIPPLVMRKPVGEEGAAGSGVEEEHTGGTARPDATLDMGATRRRPEPPAAPEASAAEPENAEPEKTSDWFAPRKQARATPAAAAGQAAGRPGDAAPAAPPAPETTQQFPAPPPPPAGGPGQGPDVPYFGDGDPAQTGPTAITPDLGGGRDGLGTDPMAGDFGNEFGSGPGNDFGNGPGNDFGSGPGNDFGGGFGNEFGNGFGADQGAGPGSGFGGDLGTDPLSGFHPEGPSGTTAEHPLGHFPPGPAGPTTSGTGEMPPPPGLGGPLGTPPPGPGAPLGAPPGPLGPTPTPPHGSPVVGGPGATAETPQGGRMVGPDLFRDPEPAPGGQVPAHVSGDTLVSGIPVVPPAEKKKKNKSGAGPKQGSGSGSGSSPFPTFEGDSSALDALTAASAAPPSPPAAAPAPAAAPKPAGKPRKKGRNKLVLLGAALVGAVGIAYAAGLVMNHADVPNGTTVLGVDIGGSSKEEAVDKLDSSLGKRAQAPLKVTVDGEQHQLKPSVAGLSLDTEGTVREVSGRDYNPVNVIGSLFGGTRTAESDPVIVDEEKLSDALERLAGESGSAREGTIKFVAGEAEPVYGKPGKGLDVEKAVAAVSEAYRNRAETGEDKAVELPVVTREPKVGKAEVERAMQEFAEPAMSGWVYLQAGGVEVPFSEQTIGEILTMKAGDDGRLQPVIDPEKLKAKYGHAFDSVVIDAGAGQVAMTPQHAAAAMTQALRKTAPALPDKRVALVEGAKSG